MKPAQYEALLVLQRQPNKVRIHVTELSDQSNRTVIFGASMLNSELFHHHVYICEGRFIAFNYNDKGRMTQCWRGESLALETFVPNIHAFANACDAELCRLLVERGANIKFEVSDAQWVQQALHGKTWGQLAAPPKERLDLVALCQRVRAETRQLATATIQNNFPATLGENNREQRIFAEEHDLSRPIRHLQRVAENLDSLTKLTTQDHLDFELLLQTIVKFHDDLLEEKIKAQTEPVEPPEDYAFKIIKLFMDIREAADKLGLSDFNAKVSM
jgi:hypothetical protein